MKTFWNCSKVKNFHALFGVSTSIGGNRPFQNEKSPSWWYIFLAQSLTPAYLWSWDMVLFWSWNLVLIKSNGCMIMTSIHPVMKIINHFFSVFHSSLIPADPPAVNWNAAFFAKLLGFLSSIFPKFPPYVSLQICNLDSNIWNPLIEILNITASRLVCDNKQPLY